MSKMALEGIRIADFSWVWAGPYCTTLLGFFGAEVIKIESMQRPDQTRKGSIMNGDTFEGVNSSPTFNNANLNKKGIIFRLIALRFWIHIFCRRFPPSGYILPEPLRPCLWLQVQRHCIPGKRCIT